MMQAVSVLDSSSESETRTCRSRSTSADGRVELEPSGPSHELSRASAGGAPVSSSTGVSHGHGNAAHAKPSTQPAPAGGDPDYELPVGAMTETQVYLAEGGGENIALDRFGFVVPATPQRRSSLHEDGAFSQAGPERGFSAPPVVRGGPASTSYTTTMPAGRTGSLAGPQQRQQQREVELRRVNKWARMMKGPNGTGGLETYAQVKPSKLKRRIRKGIPQQFRGAAWFVLTGGRALMALHPPGTFANLSRSLKVDPDIDMGILRDLNRTFPNHIFFRQRQGQGQRALYNVLRAYSAYDGRVGYVQGMGFITAVLLLHMSEEESFWTLVALMQGPQALASAKAATAAAGALAGGMGARGASFLNSNPLWGRSLLQRRSPIDGMYTTGMPLLQQCLFQLQHLLESELPRLAAHLKREKVDLAMFSMHWFTTVFAYSLPFDHLLRVWDVFMLEGVKTLFRVSVAIFRHAESQLLPLSFERLIDTLSAKNLMTVLPADPVELLQSAMNIKVSGRLQRSEAVWKKKQGGAAATK